MLRVVWYVFGCLLEFVFVVFLFFLVSGWVLF